MFIRYSSNFDRSCVVKGGMEMTKKRYWFNVISVFVILHEASSVFAFVHVCSFGRESLCSTVPTTFIYRIIFQDNKNFYWLTSLFLISMFNSFSFIARFSKLILFKICLLHEIYMSNLLISSFGWASETNH